MVAHDSTPAQTTLFRNGMHCFLNEGRLRQPLAELHLSSQACFSGNGIFLTGFPDGIIDGQGVALRFYFKYSANPDAKYLMPKMSDKFWSGIFLAQLQLQTHP